MAQEAVKSGMDMRREGVAMRNALKVFPAASNPEGFAKAVRACRQMEAAAERQIRIDAKEAFDALPEEDKKAMRAQAKAAAKK